MSHSNEYFRKILEGIPPASMDFLISILEKKIETATKRLIKEDSLEEIRKLQGQIIAFEEIKSLRDNARKALEGK